MLAQHARRTRLKVGDAAPTKTTLADVVDARLGQHGVDLEKISWDAYRREDGTWRVVATWPSGKATATAVWELDKARQVVYAPRRDGPVPVHRPLHPGARGGARARAQAPGAEPAAGTSPCAAPSSRAGRPRAPTATPSGPAVTRCSPPWSGRCSPRAAPAASSRPAPRWPSPAVPRAMQPSAFDDDRDVPQQVPAVPSLAVLRPRRGPSATDQPGDEPTTEKPRKRAPSWDDVLFGGAPTARDA